MNCDECRLILEDYFDGVLDPMPAEKVHAHIKTCNDCFTAYEMIGAEHALYERYERNIEVTPALWAAIEKRIDNGIDKRIAVESAVENQRRPGLLQPWLAAFRSMHFSPALVAAMILVAIGLTVVVTRVLESKRQTSTTVARTEEGTPSADDSNSGSRDHSAAPPTEGPGLSPVKQVAEVRKPTLGSNRPAERSAPTPAQLIREAEQKYLTAIAILSKDVDRRKSSLDPEARTRLETTLAIIDNTIEETRQAARKNPDDPIALQYLLASYSKKVDVLREMARE